MASDAITPTSRMQHLRGDRHFFSSSDDNAMMKQILATHAHDGREFDVRLVLDLIEEVLRQAPLPGIVSESSKKDALDKDFQVALTDMLEVLAYTINKICCEISCKCSGGDAHQTTVAIFNMLTNYSWDGKVMLALAAFAVNYGEFWMMAQLYPTNKLAKSVALVKQFPDMGEHAETLKPKFDALKNLIKAMLDIAKCILEFKELPSQYINADMPEMVTASANIPIAVYWTFRSIVACASQIMGLIGMGHEYIASATEAWELSSLAHKLSAMHSHLTKQLDLCYKHIDEKKQIEEYQTLVHLFKIPHMDNMKIISALINHKADLLPVFDGATKRRVSIDILRMKHVLLLITDLDFSSEEYSVLEQIYTESRHPEMRPEGQYEVVWLPVVVDRSSPWTEEKQRTFESFQNSMPWYSVHHPSLLNLAAIKYIKDVWRFNKKPLLVVLDPRGCVVNPNALHMMWIWGNPAFPFTTAREEALWKDESWKIELLMDSVEPAIFNWIAERKYICLYGGEDIEWIRKFTRKLRDAARAVNIEMEMLYMGKSNPREKVRKNSLAITGEGLSHTVPEQNLIWFFWERLESMWHSKVQHGRTVEGDPIMQEIMTMMTYDGSDQGWAVISSGGAEARMVMAKAKGDTILRCLEDFDAWREEVSVKGFVPAMVAHLEALRPPHHCSRLILPGTSGSIPDRVVCAECGRAMEKFIMYRCCTD